MSSASAPRVLGEALYILDGNVGIGTITPRSIFDIRSTLPVLIDSVAGIGIGTTNPLVSLEIHRKDSILLPKGTSDERPEEGVQGYIRYNTDTSTFEGYGAGDAWGSLGGVKDTNQDTYIAAELYPGSNDDALRFVTCNVQRMTIDAYGNVGIGTSTMGSLVDIYGATTSTAPVVTINQQGTGTILDVQDGGTSAFIVVDGGNVGIGLTEPMDTLHVNGGIISTNTQTSNLTIWNSLNIPMTSTNIRTRVQVHHIRKSFYVDAPTQSDFVVTYPGAFSGHQSNVQVFLGRDQLSYISPTIKDYDLTLTYLMEQQVTEYTISLTTPAVYGDIVDIIVWPQITQNSPEEQGIVYQSVLVNDSYWLEQDRTIPVRNTVPIYVLGNVGIGTTMPLEKLDIHGNVQVNGGVSITGNVLVTGDIVPSACNIFNLGASNFRFKDLFLSGNTIDLGGTLISRDETDGGIKVTSEAGEAVDTTVRNLFAQGNIGIGLSNPQARLDIDGGIQVAGHVIPATNVAFDLGSSGARFRDLYLSGNTLDLGGTLLKRHVTGPLMVMSEATQSMESIIGRHAYIEGTANACNVIINTNGTGTSLLVKQESQGQAVVDFQAITDYQSSLKSVFLINNNGLVGIGTTLPQEACHVEGNSLVNGTVISSNVSINTNGTGTSLVINQHGGEAIANFQSNGTSVMFVERTGQVGINTALPAEALHVEGSALVNGVIYTSNIQITSGGEGMPLFVNQIGEHPIAEFQSMGSSVLLVKQTGRVGINTSLPAEALHVEGNVVASGTITASNLVILGDYVTLDTITSNTEQMVITNDGTGPALIVTQTGPEPIADFYDDGGVLALRIADGGSVGIGTATPQAKLHVLGTALATIFSGKLDHTLSKGDYITGTNFTNESSTTWAVDATSANTASKVVARDASGNFSAGIITAELAGNASTATTLATARTINGVSFNGSVNISVNTVNTLTRGTYIIGGNTTFDGSTASTWTVDATTAETASKVVARDESGDMFARLYRSTFADQTTLSGAMAFRINNSTDNYTRFCSDTAAIRTFLNAPTRTGGDASGTWGINVTGNAGTAYGLSVHAGRNNEANKVVRTDGSGYMQAGWINTTSGDNGNTVPSRFYSSSDEFIRYHTRNTYKMHIGLTGKYDNGRVQNTADANYWVGSMGWDATDWNNVMSWGSGFTDSWGSPGNRPGDTGHHTGIQALHYTNGSAHYGWQMVNGGGTNRWWLRNIWGTGWGGWNEVIHSGNVGSYAVTSGSSPSFGMVTLTGQGPISFSYGWQIQVGWDYGGYSGNYYWAHNGIWRAYIRNNSGTTRLNFTGQHRCFVNGYSYEDLQGLQGLIVICDNNDYINMSGGTVRGKAAISIEEALPIVSISRVQKDKRVFGVISLIEDPNKREDTFGALVTPYEKEKGDTRAYINSVGEGAIWVADINGTLESGDYITSSDVPGYGMLQESPYLMNYTVAKITRDCNFEQNILPRQRIKKVSTVKIVKETEQTIKIEKRVAFDDVSQRYVQKEIEVKENVKESVDLYDETGTIIGKHLVDKKVSVTKTVVENSLDEHGNFEWEDELDSDGNVVFEEEYSMRYLLGDGTVIEKNEYDIRKLNGQIVHRAAFIGCTYHCG